MADSTLAILRQVFTDTCIVCMFVDILSNIIHWCISVFAISEYKYSMGKVRLPGCDPWRVRMREVLIEGMKGQYPGIINHRITGHRSPTSSSSWTPGIPGTAPSRLPLRPPRRLRGQRWSGWMVSFTWELRTWLKVYYPSPPSTSPPPAHFSGKVVKW